MPVVARVVPAEALSVPAEKLPPNVMLVADVISAVPPTVSVVAVVNDPPVVNVRLVPTFELVSVTAEAVSLTLAEPVVLITRVGAFTLLVATMPEPEFMLSVVPLEMLLPVAVSVILPEPLAFSVTAPVPDSVPVTVHCRCSAC